MSEMDLHVLQGLIDVWWVQHVAIHLFVDQVQLYSCSEIFKNLNDQINQFESLGDN